MVDEHLEGLGDLFCKGRQITFSIEFVYKEGSGDSTTAKGKKKSKALQRLKSFREPPIGSLEPTLRALSLQS